MSDSDPSSGSDTPPAAARSKAKAASRSTDPSRTPPYTHTRASGYWAAVVAGLLVLVVLIVFILENGQRAKISFLGAHTHLPEGVALLLSAVIGGLFVVLAGAARILQLRSRSKGRPRRAPRRRQSS